MTEYKNTEGQSILWMILDAFSFFIGYLLTVVITAVLLLTLLVISPFIPIVYAVYNWKANKYVVDDAFSLISFCKQIIKGSSR